MVYRGDLPTINGMIFKNAESRSSSKITTCSKSGSVLFVVGYTSFNQGHSVEIRK